MNRVIFTVGDYRIKVRDVAIIVFIVLLLLFILKGCNENKGRKRIENKCAVVSMNLNELDHLLNRADLCSEDWYKDVDVYIERLAHQNDVLEDEKDIGSQKMLISNKEILKALEAFKDNPNEATLTHLEMQMKTYKALYKVDLTCDKGGVYR